MIDHGDVDGAGLRFQLQTQLRLDGVEDRGAGLEARVPIDGAEEADVEVPGDPCAVEHWTFGDTRQKVGELAEAAETAQFRGSAAGGRHQAEIRVQFERRGLAVVQRL